MELRKIEITEAAEKYGNLNLRCCGADFFPEGIFGGATSDKLGVQISIKAEGINSLIKTDIPTESNSGKPRWIFRERHWVKDFVRLHKLSPGDMITIQRLDKTTYIITSNNHKNTTISKHFETFYLDKVFFKDARNMSELPDNSIHLIITSPPYFNIKDYSLDGRQRYATGHKIKGQIGDISHYEEYLHELTKVWIECFRVLKPNGKLCVNTPLMPILKEQSNTHYSRDIVDINAGIQYEILHNTKFFLYDVFIWDRTNPTKKLMFGSYPYDN
jgi:hypothetical protein